MQDVSGAPEPQTPKPTKPQNQPTISNHQTNTRAFDAVGGGLDAVALEVHLLRHVHRLVLSRGWSRLGGWEFGGSSAPLTSSTFFGRPIGLAQKVDFCDAGCSTQVAGHVQVGVLTNASLGTRPAVDELEP